VNGDCRLNFNWLPIQLVRPVFVVLDRFKGSPLKQSRSGNRLGTKHFAVGSDIDTKHNCSNDSRWSTMFADRSDLLD